MKLGTKLTLKVVITSIALIASGSAFAESGQAAVNLNNKMKQACSDKDEGDVCDFTNDKGESINGQCKRSGSTSDSDLNCIATN
jgi:hypothetical protein